MYFQVEVNKYEFLSAIIDIQSTAATSSCLLSANTSSFNVQTSL